MPSGTVIFFSVAKGYGFIAPDGGGRDYFVHVTSVEAARMAVLEKGQRVTFDVQVARNGKISAVKIALLTT